MEPTPPKPPPSSYRLPDPQFPFTTCRACGRKIVWAIDVETGAKHPLDAVAPTYVVMTSGDTEKALNSKDWITKLHYEGRNTAGRAVYVSHFATCPGVDQIKKEQQEKQLDLPLPDNNKQP